MKTIHVGGSNYHDCNDGESSRREDSITKQCRFNIEMLVFLGVDSD